MMGSSGPPAGQFAPSPGTGPSPGVSPPASPYAAQSAPVQATAAAQAPAPRLSDPVETLSLELGISHLKAKRLVEAGIAVEHLRRMGEGDIARLLQDPETARVIKLRVGHEVTEREARNDLDVVKRNIEPLIRLARELGTPAADLEGGVEKASDCIAGSRPAEAMEAVRRLREAAGPRRTELLSMARADVTAGIRTLEANGVDASRLRDAIARIDVAIATDDSAEGARAAQDGLAAVRELSGRIDGVKRDAARGAEVVDLLDTLGQDVLAMRGELRICDGLMKGGKWEEAAEVVDRLLVESSRQVQDTLAGAIVREKRRALELKLKGTDVKTQVVALRSSQEALRRGAVHDAVSQFRKYQEAAGTEKRA